MELPEGSCRRGAGVGQGKRRTPIGISWTPGGGGAGPHGAGRSPRSRGVRGTGQFIRTLARTPQRPLQSVNSSPSPGARPADPGAAGTRVEPRVLDVDLARPGDWHPRPFPGSATAEGARGEPPAFPESARLAGWRGGGLSLALLLESAHAQPARESQDFRPGEVPLVLSIGDCVPRAVPTAARLGVASRSPLSGLLAEGQVGSDLARRLSSVADAVCIRGVLPESSRGGAVLVIESDGRAHVERFAELVGRSSRATHRALESRLGPCATLSIGPLGESCAPIASLAACSSSTAGGGLPHFVGRGGLGAVLGLCGLKAVAVRATWSLPPADPPGAGPIVVPGRAPAAARHHELLRALSSSPRLVERAQGGTLELASALSARGDLGASGEEATAAERFGQEALSARSTVHGCQGCPTPCGWVFRRKEGPPQSARFGASQALGLQLGFSDFDAALGLLARCDELGIDAKEVGAGLALMAELEPEARGQPQVFARWLEEAARAEAPGAPGAPAGSGAGPRRGRNALLLGVHGLGEVLGRATTSVRRCSVRPDKNLASLLGQCVSARGTDPMRAFPFLAAEAGGFESLREWCAPLELPEGSEDPFSPVGKGRLVGWHEDFVLALDLSGFCAFSASALLADRMASLDSLALWIAPSRLAEEPEFPGTPGRSFLAAGALLARLQRELNRRWRWEPAHDVPEWARQRLSAPGMEPEYRRYREDRGALERPEAPGNPGSRPVGPAEGPGPRSPGRVLLRAFGSLGEALGAVCEVRLDLPATAREVLRAAAEARPRARNALFRGEVSLPAIYRGGKRVDPRDPVRDGDTLDLLLVVGGG